MNLSEIKVIERDLNILHPGTKEETGLVITMMGAKDPRLDKLRKSVAQKQLNMQFKNKQPKVEDALNDQQRILFAAIVRWKWDGDAQWDGEKPDLTPAIWKDICERASWIMEQVQEEFTESERFFENAEPN